MDWQPLIWKRGWNSVGERRVRIRDAKISQSGIGRSGWPRDLYEVIRGTSFATWQPFLRARELLNFLAGHAMENCSLFFSLFFNTFRGDLFFPLWREFRKIPSSTERERSLFSNIIKVFQSSPLPSRSWEEWGRIIRPRILMKAVFFFQSKIRKVNICIRSFIYSLYRWIRGKICLMFRIE